MDAYVEASVRSGLMEGAHARLQTAVTGRGIFWNDRHDQAARARPCVDARCGGWWAG